MRKKHKKDVTFWVLFFLKLSLNFLRDRREIKSDRVLARYRIRGAGGGRPTRKGPTGMSVFFVWLILRSRAQL